MKKIFEVKFPVNLGPHFAKWTYEKGIVVQLSYVVDEFLSGEKVVAFAIVPEEVENDFKTEFKTYIK